MSRIITLCKTFITSLPSKLSSWGKKKLLISAAVVVATAVLIAIQINSSETPTDPVAEERAVKVATVASLTNDRSPLPLLGLVRSQAEATILTESQGQIIRVSYDLGDFVTAGVIIAELENSSQHAGVFQARGAVASAQANLDKVSRETLREQGEVSVDAITAYRNAFTLADDAVSNKTEPFFSGAHTSAPQLTISTFGDTTIDDDRGVINDLLALWNQKLNTLTTESDLFTSLEKAENDLNFIKNFLTRLAGAVNRQEPSSALLQTTIDGQKASMLSARTNVNTAITSIISARNDLNSTLAFGSSGGSGESDAALAIAKASLTQAQGSLRIALAALEKTLIRTPISGTINLIDLELGDFVASFKPVVTIANNNALEIEAFIAESDRRDIAVGNSALIGGVYKGVVTRIAPALDRDTKKIKIKIGIEDSEVMLTSGESVEIEIDRTTSYNLLAEESAGGPFAIPISALKITTNETLVFTVDSENRLVAHLVVESSLIGEKILIKEGLTGSMEIVLDARGLKEGQKVIISQ